MRNPSTLRYTLKQNRTMPNFVVRNLRDVMA